MCSNLELGLNFYSGRSWEVQNRIYITQIPSALINLRLELLFTTLDFSTQSLKQCYVSTFGTSYSVSQLYYFPLNTFFFDKRYWFKNAMVQCCCFFSPQKEIMYTLSAKQHTAESELDESENLATTAGVGDLSGS